MRRAPWLPLVTALLSSFGLSAGAQDFELEFTEEALNRLVGRLGDPSSGGMHQPNPTLELGYTNCTRLGSLDCPGGTQAGDHRVESRTRVLLSRCDGPGGKRRVVPGAEPVSWQWWITAARFSVDGRQLLFSASVRYRVGRQWFKEEGTAPATLRLDVASQRLRVDVSAFKVPIRHRFGAASETLTEVEVGRFMSFAIPVGGQAFQVRGLDGTVRTLTARARSANVEYLPGRIKVGIDATFN